MVAWLVAPSYFFCYKLLSLAGGDGRERKARVDDLIRPCRFFVEARVDVPIRPGGLLSWSDVVVLMPQFNRTMCVQVVRLGCKSELLGRVCDKLGNDELFSLTC